MTEPDEDNHLNSSKMVGNRVIRVTHVEEASRIVIITVTPRRRLSGSHRNGA